MMPTKHFRGAAVAVTAVLAVGGTAAGARAAVGLDVAASTAVTQTVATENPVSVVEQASDGTILVRLTGSVTPDESIVVDGSLLGEVVVVPGDADQSSILVRNEGPTSGTLTASIVNAVAHRDLANGIDDTFYDDLTVNGVPAAELEGGTTVIHEVELARGATVDLPVSFELPVDATSGNYALVGARVFSFDVSLRIAGDVPASAGQVGDSAGQDAGGTDDGGQESGSEEADGTAQQAAGSSTGSSDGTGAVTHTGGAVLSGERAWLLLVAAALAAVAGAGVRGLRRRPRPATSEAPR